MDLIRVFRHLLMPGWRVRAAFPERTLQTIETAIRECETTHAGQIRFVAEGALHPFALLHNQSARERALEVFSQLRVWDTERNNGVLIYLLLADHDVEIVADRGIHPSVRQEAWEIICRKLEPMFRMGKYESGVIAGIQAIGAHLNKHYPPNIKDNNELPDAPVLM